MPESWATIRCRQCDDAGKAAIQPFCDHQESYVTCPDCDFHTDSCGAEDFCCRACPNLEVNQP